jgi:hypothetical protein
MKKSVMIIGFVFVMMVGNSFAEIKMYANDTDSCVYVYDSNSVVHDGDNVGVYTAISCPDGAKFISIILIGCATPTWTVLEVNGKKIENPVTYPLKDGTTGMNLHDLLCKII